jgi:hypothetical protein
MNITLFQPDPLVMTIANIRVVDSLVFDVFYSTITREKSIFVGLTLDSVFAWSRLDQNIGIYSRKYSLVNN